MLFDDLREEIFNHVKTALLPETIELSLEYPPDLKFGDFAFPTFKLAKTLRKAPPVIAQELCKKLEAQPLCTSKFDIQAAGPYVNFKVKNSVLLSDVLKTILFSKEKLAEKIQSPQPCVVLEFSSPNVAKAFNIYHLRSTMIGNSLYRIYQARGFQPVSINHLGDWGTQFGTLALAYTLWGNSDELEKNGIAYLVELYVRINKEIESKPELADQARDYFSRLEKGDPQIRSLWKNFVDLSLKEFRRTYERLNVHFDYFWGESFYIDQLEALEHKLKQTSLLKESEGAQVVDLEQFGMPACIIRKQDGSSIYATRDLAAAIYRHKQFDFSKMIYIVGGEQKLHFAQVFKVLELMGNSWAQRCSHVDFGLYRFGNQESGFQKMSTRKGNFITMEAVLDQAVERVEEIMISKQSIDMDEEERRQCAEIIGVGAIVFHDLSTDRNQDVNFDFERVLDFDGETGPYILYAHTRALSILRNAPKELIPSLDIATLLDLTCEQPGFENLFQAAQTNLNEVEETDLLRVLAKMPLILDIVLEQSKPNHLANYLIDVTKAFNSFYRTHKVLTNNNDLTKARLALVCATQRTLLKGLTLLGMRVPQRM